MIPPNSAYQRTQAAHLDRPFAATPPSKQKRYNIKVKSQAIKKGRKEEAQSGKEVLEVRFANTGLEGAHNLKVSPLYTPTISHNTSRKIASMTTMS